MKRKIKILAFSGSLRKNSLNKRALKAAITGAEAAGAEVTFVDLTDFPMPVYNPDDHEINGFDKNALRLQGLLATHDGLLIASPEYNGSLPAALKNAIDWASRPSDEHERSKIFAGKFAAMMTASPGSLGGIRSLAHLRGVLNSVGVNVLPQEVAVTFAHEKFNGETEEMTDAGTKTILEDLGANLTKMLKSANCEN